MNFKQLEAFLSVAEHQSFTKAARQLYMSQPAISFQIKALEETLGVTLFQRNEKKVTLTEAGRLLYPEARQLLRHYHKIKAGLEDLKELKTGHLVIGASTTPGEYLLPLLIGGFRRQYPGIQVTLRIAGSGNIERWIHDKEVDLGVTGTPIEGEDVVCHPWLKDQLALIVSPDHPWNSRKSVKVTELLEQPFIFREAGSGTRRTFEFKLAGKGIALEQCNVAMELGSTRAVITAVQAGLGISVVSIWAIQEFLKLGRLQKVLLEDLDLDRYLYTVYHQNWLSSFAAEAFLNFISKEGNCQQYLGTECVLCTSPGEIKTQ